MGFLDRFFSKKEEKKSSGGTVRYLCTPEKKYSNMKEFMEDFYDIVNETIERFNKSNPVKAETLDKSKAHKSGGRWIYKANIKQIDEEGLEVENDKNHFATKKSTFDVIAREQPHFGIEINGTERLVKPFLNELKGVLGERGLGYDFTVIARHELGETT